MQYPQIQFYRGSLVRLANGQLKQVEDLSSDDFIESARLAASTASTPKAANEHGSRHHAGHPLNRSTLSLSSARGAQNESQNRFNFQPIGASAASGNSNHLRGNQNGGSSGTLDENNNSVFNSPEPTSASYDDSPTRMDIEEDDDEVELDVVTNDDHEPSGQTTVASGVSESMRSMHQVSELVSNHPGATLARHSPAGATHLGKLELESHREPFGQLADFYVDSSVVRDFLEVAPIQEQMSGSIGKTNNIRHPAGSSSPASSTSSQQAPIFSPRASTSGCSPARPGHSRAPASPSSTTLLPQITSAAPASTTQTVLIKFFLETSRSIAFIEVPIEHPFFVLHRGWSSWNPQMTYETFGLKCRKLKIGDTCISLIRRRQKAANSHHESDQCNILFSSININE